MTVKSKRPGGNRGAEEVTSEEELPSTRYSAAMPAAPLKRPAGHRTIHQCRIGPGIDEDVGPCKCPECVAYSSALQERANEVWQLCNKYPGRNLGRRKAVRS